MPETSDLRVFNQSVDEGRRRQVRDAPVPLEGWADGKAADDL